jgi:hypothetical protein
MRTLDLTPAMHIAYLADLLDRKLAARKLLRSDRQAAARRGVETKRRAG